MSFGTFIYAEMNWIDTVHLPSFKRYPIERSGFYRAKGKVVTDFDVCSLEVHYMEKVGYKMRMQVLIVILPTLTLIHFCIG